jgi:ABC-type spermidine/putrescine transport system permease subunit II
MKIFQFNPGTRATLYSITVVTYLFVFAPVLFVIYASFDPNEIMSYPYKGFSFRWYREFFANPVLYLAATNSLIVAACAGVIAVLIGGLAAYSIARLTIPGKRFMQGMIAAPMIVSKIILGVALLVVIVKLGIPRGFGSLITLHTLLCLPFGYLVLWARLMTSGRDYWERTTSRQQWQSQSHCLGPLRWGRSSYVLPYLSMNSQPRSSSLSRKLRQCQFRSIL